MSRDGGMSTDALRCYNKTWERAGNDKFAGPLTQDILLCNSNFLFRCIRSASGYYRSSRYPVRTIQIRR